jgi:4-aminobutyrate aminotransferase / (S)-3-amino-2-methylpropionate transaminase
MFRVTKPIARVGAVTASRYWPSTALSVRVTTPTSMRYSSADGEPSKPRVITRVPGPKSVDYLSRLGKYQDVRTAQVVMNVRESAGNYLTDIDGNTFLDFHSQIASIAIGYNNAMFEKSIDHRTLLDACNRPALGVFPPDYLLPGVEKIMSKAPTGLDKVSLSMSGSDANEIAFKLAFMRYQSKRRGENSFTEQELESTMSNRSPGSPNLSVLSFNKGFHGRSMGSLSATRSKPIHKIDIPAFDWPVAPFPKLKYPLDDDNNVVANRLEEHCCLRIVEEIIKTADIPVAALIVEPVQAEGGDNRATPYFFQGLRSITQQYGLTLIVDEVQTGVGGTGKFWAHESWDLLTPPDIVTFAKKMQVAGLYYKSSYVPSHPFRNFNTWMGNPLDILKAGVIIDYVDDHHLVDKVQMIGKDLIEELIEFDQISNVRGSGAFIAFDVENENIRNDIIEQMRNRGVLINGCGERTIRLRPMLIYEYEHVAIFLTALNEVLKTL